MWFGFCSEYFANTNIFIFINFELQNNVTRLATSTTYHGLSLHVTNLGGNDYIDTFISGNACHLIWNSILPLVFIICYEFNQNANIHSNKIHIHNIVSCNLSLPNSHNHTYYIVNHFISHLNPFFIYLYM